jgi:hypothetical protein
MSAAGPRATTNRKLGLAILGVIAVISATVYLLERDHWPPGEPSIKQMLRALPYRFEFRPVPTPEGADYAIAGKVLGPHRTAVNFGISFGGGAVPVPHAGTLNAVGGSAFTVTDDSVVRGNDGQFTSGPLIHDAAQDREAAKMIGAIEEMLCQAKTGEPCGI